MLMLLTTVLLLSLSTNSGIVGIGAAAAQEERMGSISSHWGSSHWERVSRTSLRSSLMESLLL